MSGRLVGLFLVLSGLAAGIAVYVLQLYVFYEEVDARDVSIQLTRAATQTPEPIPADDLRVIDATSSPLRFRACFRTELGEALEGETFQRHPDPVPLNGPGWFDCYDAAAIGAALENRTAIAYLSEKEIAEGVDRVVAIFADGRGYAWHQLNETFAD